MRALFPTEHDLVHFISVAAISATGTAPIAFLWPSRTKTAPYLDELVVSLLRQNQRFPLHICCKHSKIVNWDRRLHELNLVSCFRPKLLK